MPSALEFANLGQAVGRPDYRRDVLLAYWLAVADNNAKATTLNDVMMFSCCFG